VFVTTYSTSTSTEVSSIATAEESHSSPVVQSLESSAQSTYAVPISTTTRSSTNMRNNSPTRTQSRSATSLAVSSSSASDIAASSSTTTGNQGELSSMSTGLELGASIIKTRTSANTANIQNGSRASETAIVGTTSANSSTVLRPSTRSTHTQSSGKTLQTGSSPGTHSKSQSGAGTSSTSEHKSSTAASESAQSSATPGSDTESTVSGQSTSSETTMSFSKATSSRTSLPARPGSLSQTSGPSATPSPSSIELGTASVTGSATSTTSQIGLLAAIGTHTVSLSVGKATMVSGTRFLLGLHSSVFINDLPLESSPESSQLSIFEISPSSTTALPFSINLPQATSTCTPTGADVSKWDSQMQKESCKPPCTQTLPILSLAKPQKVQFWNITTSFCKEVNSVTYTSTTTIKPPEVLVSELSFDPVSIPSWMERSAMVVPYYNAIVTTEPPLKISVAPGATPCPSAASEVSTDGSCGLSVRCPGVECCGDDNTCGVDQQHCWTGCQRDFGACWQSETGGLPNEAQVFDNPNGIPEVATIDPPDHGRGVVFEQWVYCWDCKPDRTLFPPLGGAQVGWGFGGGGCFFGSCHISWPKVHICILFCSHIPGLHGSADNPLGPPGPPPGDDADKTTGGAGHKTTGGGGHGDKSDNPGDALKTTDDHNNNQSP